MSTKTTNYELIKPDLNDPADITQTNANWDKLDRVVKENLDEAKEYTDEKLKSIPTPDVSGQINEHNINGAAHADIRAGLQGKVSKNGDTINGNLTVEGAFSVTRSDTGRHARTVAHNNDQKEIDVQNYGSDSNYLALRLGTEKTGVGDAVKVAHMSDGKFAAYTVLHTGNKEKIFTFGTEDLVAGSSPLGTGQLHFVYE